MKPINVKHEAARALLEERREAAQRKLQNRIRMAQTACGGMNMDTRESILQRDFSEPFVSKMKNAIVMSHYKYGWMSQTYPELAQAHKCIQERLELYLKTHNTEYLIDVANFAMIEFMHPSFEDSRYTPTDSDSSPGLAGGISYKQMVEGMK